MPAHMSPRLLSVATVVALSAAAQVPFTAETTPTPTATAGDMALVAPADLGGGLLVVAGDPLQSGLYVFGAGGPVIATAAQGLVNGVDSRSGLSLPALPSTLVAIGAGTLGRVLVFGVGADGGLSDVTANAPAGLQTGGALAMWRQADGGVDVFTDDGQRSVRRFALVADGAGRVRVEAGDTYVLPGTPSALAADDVGGVVYAAIPALGVYALDVERGIVSQVAPADGGDLGGAPSGLTFYPRSSGDGLLFASVPASGEVVVLSTWGARQARFTIAQGSRVVHDPRDLDVTPHRLLGFDAGVLVVRDGAEANYKLVPLEALAGPPYDVLLEVPEDGVGPGDAGVDDGGLDDGGVDDGGLDDGGLGDGGAADAGSRPRPGTGTTVGPTPSPTETGCGCGASTGADVLFVAGLLGLWLFLGLRRRRTGAA